MARGRGGVQEEGRSPDLDQRHRRTALPLQRHSSQRWLDRIVEHKGIKGQSVTGLRARTQPYKTFRRLFRLLVKSS